MWIQYATADGRQCATNTSRVSDDALAALGRAQIECPPGTEDPTLYDVDVTTDPPTLILRQE